MKFNCFSFLIVIFLSYSSSVFADCRSDLNSLYKLKKISSEDVMGLKSKCEGSGYYEMMLAQSYIEEHDFHKAREVINQIVKDDLPLKNIILRISIDIDYYQKMIEGNASEIQWSEIRDKYEKLVSNIVPSNDFMLYLNLAEVYIELKDYEKSIQMIQQAFKIDIQPRLYSLLVICMSSLEKWEYMVEYFEQAYGLNPNVFSEIDTMTSLSHGYTKMGDYVRARNSLIKLLQENPSAESDPKFSKAVDFLEFTVNSNRKTNN